MMSKLKMHLLEPWYLTKGVVPLSEDEKKKHFLLLLVIFLIGDATGIRSNYNSLTGSNAKLILLTQRGQINKSSIT